MTKRNGKIVPVGKEKKVKKVKSYSKTTDKKEKPKLVGEGVNKHYVYRGFKIRKKRTHGMGPRMSIVGHTYFEVNTKEFIPRGDKLSDAVAAIDEFLSKNNASQGHQQSNSKTSKNSINTGEQKNPLTEKMEEVKAKIANDKDGSNPWTTEERYRFVKNPDKNVFDQVPYQVSKHEQSFEVRDEKGRRMGYFVSIHHPTNESENYQVYGLQLRGGRSFGAGFKPPFANLKTLEQAKAAALEKIAQMKKKIHANAAKHNGVYVTGKKRG